MARNVFKIGFCLAAVPLLLSCGDVEPTAPLPPDPSGQLAAAPNNKQPQLADDGLAIEEMLLDPLFQSSIEYVTEEVVLDPLLGAVDALERGQLARATNLIEEAQAEADALLDDPSVDFDNHISWSVLERYFEEAELI